jgi:hypothetical protein
LRPFAFVVFDGQRLSADPKAPGRRLRVDSRCLEGDRVAGSYAHVCALPDRSAALRYDEPEVQQARRDALACDRWNRLQVGSPVEVRYDPRNPDRHV